MLPQIKTILLAASLDKDTTYLFNYALCLAERHQAVIYVVHGYEMPYLGMQDMAELYMLQDDFTENFERSLQEVKVKLQERLESLCREQQERFPQCQALFKGVSIVNKPPKQAIIETAAELQADLILMGSHRHSMLTNALLGSTTMKVLHNTSIPVFVVRIPAEGHH